MDRSKLPEGVYIAPPTRPRMVPQRTFVGSASIPPPAPFSSTPPPPKPTPSSSSKTLQCRICSSPTRTKVTVSVSDVNEASNKIGAALLIGGFLFIILAFPPILIFFIPAAVILGIGSMANGIFD